MYRTDLFRFLSDKTYIRFKYFLTFHRKANLENPKTFNEKLNWLKLYDRNPVYTIMVDKELSKKYVEKMIGNQYIIPTIGVYDSFDDINFENLPNQFVIKTNHDCGGVVLCSDKNKLDIKKARKKINKHLKTNYYYGNREWPYKNVKPRILIEKFIQDNNKDINDYKFFCFNGTVKFFKIDFNRSTNHQANYYDKAGNLLQFGEAVCPPDFTRKLFIPNNLEKMIKLAEKLSSNVPFLRVDFYNVNNKIYFGELTLYPAAGVGKFVPDKYDRIIGDYLDLPNNN